jgi:hypothetical protein
MATAEERKRILKLIQEGKITAEEGAKLLNDLGSSDSNSKRRPPPGLIDWGLQIGAQYAPEVGGLDLNQLSEMLDEGTMGKIVDVINEEDGEHVEIYVE